jgi:hypothetical protein
MNKDQIPMMVSVDPQGKETDLSVLEENDIAFDPSRQTVDLTKEEKRRTTALMMAIHAYDKLIIKDAEMYNAISRDRDRTNGPVIQPATMDAMVEAAMQFDAFIAGKFSVNVNVEPPSKAEE